VQVLPFNRQNKLETEKQKGPLTFQRIWQMNIIITEAEGGKIKKRALGRFLGRLSGGGSHMSLGERGGFGLFKVWIPLANTPFREKTPIHHTRAFLEPARRVG